MSYSLKIEGDQGVLHIEALEQMPVGGVAVSWPGTAPPPNHSIQLGFGRWLGTDLRINELPFTIVFPR